MSVVQGHHEYRRHLQPLDGAAFATRLVELLGAYDAEVVAVQLNLLGSHDAPRALTVLGGDLAAMRMATLLQCLLPGAPCIYYGDEIGLTGGNDPANRSAFPWDTGRWQADFRTFVRDALALRAAEPAFRHGATVALGATGPAMAIERRLDASRLVLALNPGDGPIDLEIGLDGVASGRLEPVPLDVPNEGVVAGVEVVDGAARLPLSPRTGSVFRVVPVDG